MTKQRNYISIIIFIFSISFLFSACIPQLIPGLSSTTAPQEQQSENALATPVQSDLPTISPSQTATYQPTQSVSWRALGSSAANINTIAIHPMQSKTLYAGGNNTIFRSETGGENWQVAYTYEASVEDTIKTIIVDPDAPNMIYAAIYNQGVIKSEDNGTTWLPANYGLKDNKILTLEINPTNSNIIYAGTESGLYKTVNKGKIWEFAGDSFKGFHVNSIAIDPFSPSTIYVGTTELGLFKSLDGGESWNLQNLGLYIKTASMNQEAPTWVQDIAINPIDPETLYLAGYGAFKSTDGGNTWQAINNGLGNDSDGLPRNITYIQISPQAPDTIYAISSRDAVFRSDNGGMHWYPYNTGINFGIGEGPISPIAFDPYQPSTMYIGTWNDGAFTTRQTRIYYPTETPTIYDCSLGWSKLKAGMYAYVVGEVYDAPNRVREQPYINAEQVGQVFPGMVLKILEGPECSDGLVYWKVENNNIESGSGWTAEGDLENYWLEPYN